MARAKVISKISRVKKEKLEMQKKVEGRIKIVNTANKQKDPLDALPSFKVLSKNEVTWNLSTQRITDLDKEEKSAIVDLLMRNMKTQYEKSGWGWNEKSKRDEMMDKAAWYLLLKNEEGKIYGFSHFRYDMDCNEEVLYVYEIQIEEDFQKEGLGTFMMKVLEMLAFKADMRKIILTVLKDNEPAMKFFKTNLEFEPDVTNPVKSVQWNEKYKTTENVKNIDFEILSKYNKKKLNVEAMENLSLNKPQSTGGSGCADEACGPTSARRGGG